MIRKITNLIFDADDTLWSNNIYYLNASSAFFELMESAGIKHETIEQDFNRMEVQVVQERGYGSINFVYILETLFEKYKNDTSKTPDRNQLRKIINEFNQHSINPPAMFEDVIEVLTVLKKNYKLYILTKGDYEEQSRKIRNAGLLPLIEDFYIPKEKNDQTYVELLRRMKWIAEETCMIGNSPKSDINPALRVGMHAVYIPYSDTWKLDKEPIQPIDGRLITINAFSDLLTIL